MKKTVVVKINELCESRGISLKDLSKLTEIEYEALYEFANQSGQSFNLNYVERIGDVLHLKDIREIIDIVDDLS
jgi:DNA-binding Xre family transcriptional regulator